MIILVTGGAGYIGSITNQLLRSLGHKTIVFDNLSTGHESAVGDTPLEIGDLTRPEEINKVFDKYQIDAVVHFAALALAGESMQIPAKYYQTNVMGGLNLLEAMRKHNCTQIVFSSTCAVYGFPDTLPVTEETPKKPVSVYGSSKLMFEEILHRYEELFGLKVAILRYFNACGASLDGSLGENHQAETHIIPNALKAATEGTEFPLFGNDYKTPDGTCIRDYIHVLDLATAHEKALQYLAAEKKSLICNLGSMHGYSNLEILKAIEAETGHPVPYAIKPRRPGDPDMIYADASKAKQLLGWEANYSDLKTIIHTAWPWHQKRNTSRSQYTDIVCG